MSSTQLRMINKYGVWIVVTCTAGVHYRLFSVWTLVPVRLGKQLLDNSTVDEIASEAADCRLTYTMANYPQRRRTREKKREETEKEKKKNRERERGAGLGWRKGLSPRLEWKEDERRWC
ncbi:hypothetical protein TNCV_3447281 [Trichonephila clavipes]|nr:hypothetical protein TNCV_3447281 [Trichonephila clavipes]